MIASGKPLTTGVAAGAGFRIGDSLGQSLVLFRRHVLIFFLAGGAVMLPYAWVMLTRRDVVLPIQQIVPALPHAVASLVSVSRILAFILRGAGETLILAILVVRRDGRAPTAVSVLRRTLACLVPVVGIRLCLNLGIVTGDVLVYSNGRAGQMAGAVMILVALTAGIICLVAPAVAVAEGLGVVASLRRSAELTRRHRLKLFGVFVLLATPSLGASWLCNQFLHGGGSRIAYIGLQFTVEGLFIGFSTVVGFQIYGALSASRDGAVPSRLAAVFD